MKTFNTNFSDISKDIYLRSDIKYHYFISKTTWNIFNLKKTIRLKEVLIDNYKNFDFQDDEEYYGIPTGQSYIDEDGYLIDSQTITKEEHPNRLKYKLSEHNILISSLRLAKSPSLNFENIDFEKYVFSNGFYIFNAKENWNKKFILYLLRNKKIKYIIDNCIYRGIGISAYKDSDLLNIKIPLIPLLTQNSIASQIASIEEKIASLKSQIEDPKIIINEVFSRYFDFDVNLYNEFGKGMTAGTQIAKNKEMRLYSINFSNFSNSCGLRFSTRFHNDATRKLMSILSGIKTKKLNEILIGIEKGVQPQYDKDGDIDIIKIANLKNSFIDFNECEKTNKLFLNTLNENKILKLNDIILCCTGKISLGKIDIVDNIDNVCLTSVDNTILKIKNYNYLFLVYFFRSILGYFQIERDYSGATNQIHLYPKDISKFLIPDISLREQEKIVNEIKLKIDKQNEINSHIKAERDKIDNLINSVLI